MFARIIINIYMCAYNILVYEFEYNDLKCHKYKKNI